MKHHYVPQFLQRAWSETTPDKHIEVFRLDLKSVRSDRHSPEWTGFDRDLYALTVPVVAGMNKQDVEKLFLSKVDNAGALVRDKLAAQGPTHLTKEEWIDWAIFLMTMRIRQPDIVGRLRTESAVELRRQLELESSSFDELHTGAEPVNPVDWTERQFPGLIENFGLSFFHELAINPDIGQKLTALRWSVFDLTTGGRELLLADNPLIFTGGIDSPDLAIALPISPTKLFLATRGTNVRRGLLRTTPAELAKSANESSLLQARERIYARDAKPKRFIANRFRHLPLVRNRTNALTQREDTDAPTKRR